ncbi:hypothetical protein N3K66_008405 [Trichothecium roseum]|uniref:Uncharacterized protein n=1 Tax=Trichothecium roseum TaxID=47278 RepID=A0ACC0UQ52_9HYPO|nr:hypothetical protein N3K66_008405 [Trichothecium roseum]
MESAARGGRGDPFPAFNDGPVHSKQSSSSIVHRIPFIRSSSDATHDDEADADAIANNGRAILQEQNHQSRTRRRKGSLRKVALLGRGVEHERKDSSPLVSDASPAMAQTESRETTPRASSQRDALGIDVDGTNLASKPTAIRSIIPANQTTNSSTSSVLMEREPSMSYTSTTDEEDVLQFPPSSTQLRPTLALSTASDPYYSAAADTIRRRSFHQAKSPLSYTGGLTSSNLPAAEAEWDYAETEWWGWVVLIVTWLVFVMGMGSCFGVWSWAWDVGRTPYAPPELEDDPTLPIVGYYPALIMLTGVMAWVWVFHAWLGMKYFRHAKISGD